MHSIQTNFKTNNVARLVNITNSIFKLYNDLTDNCLNQKELQKTLENLKIALELENEIYQSIGEETLLSQEFHNEFDHEIYTRFETSDQRDFISYLDSDEIKCRFYNYISYLIYRYPFLSNTNSRYTNIQEDYDTIEQHYFFDYDLLTLYYFNSYLKDKSLSEIKPHLTSQKNRLLFETKIFDNYAFEDPQEPELKARERLIAFNHNPEIVNEIFTNLLVQELNQALSFSLKYGLTEQTIDDFANLVSAFISIQTCLEMLDYSTLLKHYTSYQKQIQSDIYVKSLIRQCPIVNEKIHEAYNESITKKKIKNQTNS